MTKIDGKATVNNCPVRAEKWSDGAIFVRIGSHWFRLIGQDDTFVAT
jgi:hypothetical protein